MQDPASNLKLVSHILKGRTSLPKFCKVLLCLLPRLYKSATVKGNTDANNFLFKLQKIQFDTSMVCFYISTNLHPFNAFLKALKQFPLPFK